MIDINKGIIQSGQFLKVCLNGNWCNINMQEYPEAWAEVTAYLASHPEALVPEPVPPPPSAEELKARRVAEIKAEILALDAATIRPLRAGETARVDEIEAQVVALRAELMGLA